MRSFALVIARSEATKQSIYPLCCDTDCFASLAMTVEAYAVTTPPLLRRPIYCSSANTPVAIACATTTI